MSLTLEDLYTAAGKKDQVVLVPGASVAFTYDNSGHTRHVYQKQENGLFSEVELDLHSMALKLAEGLDKVQFMKDVLKTMPIEQILVIKDLLPKAGTTVKSRGGCFNLVVLGEGGKKSRIVLR